MSYRNYVLIFAPAGRHSLQAMVLLNQTKESFAEHAKDFPGEPHYACWMSLMSEPVEPAFLPSVVLFGPGGYCLLKEMGTLPNLIEMLETWPEPGTTQINHMQVAEVFAFSPGVATTVYPTGPDGPPMDLKGEALLLIASGTVS